jgi:D-glycero-alpha-D-manno-heptose 1-phosphate guanylyltransferase
MNPKALPPEAIVLAGGFGTRLRSVVEDVPKPLAPVASRPFLAWLLDALAEGGVQRVVLAIGYLGEMVQTVIGTEHRGMAVAYSQENAPLGTGGAIREAMRLTTGARVLALNGDTFARVPYAEMAAAISPDAIGMAVLRMADRSRYGSVQIVDGVVRGFNEKLGGGAGCINCGVYLLPRALLALQRPGAFSLERDVLEAEVIHGGLRAFEICGPFIDIGTPEDYAQAQSLLPAWQLASSLK